MHGHLIQLLNGLNFLFPDLEIGNVFCSALQFKMFVNKEKWHIFNFDTDSTILYVIVCALR